MPHPQHAARRLGRSKKSHLRRTLHLERLEDRSVPAAGLVLALAFDEPSGPTVNDSSGFGNHGSIFEATRTPAGKYGAAVSFDGVNDWITIADSSSLDLTIAVTMEAWVRPTRFNNMHSVVVKEAPNVYGMTYQLYANNGYPEPAAYVFTSSDRQVTGTAPLPLGAWSHLAATYDGAALKLYVNGNLVGNKPVTGTMAVTGNPFRIGGDGPYGEFFEGQIDEIRIYNRALSEAEIQLDRDTPVGGGGVTPTLPAVSISATDAAAAEAGQDPGRFTVTRTGDTAAALTVQYTRGGSATNGSDYANLATSVTIPAGAASAVITVTPVDDAVVEAAETVVLTLAGDASYVLGSPSTATVTIADNDTASPGTFQDTVFLSGLTQPTVVRFAPDGRVFVAEKSGLIKVFDSPTDTTPDIFADLRTSVHNFWDRGLLGMALDPDFADRTRTSTCCTPTTPTSAARPQVRHARRHVATPGPTPTGARAAQRQRPAVAPARQRQRHDRSGRGADPGLGQPVPQPLDRHPAVRPRRHALRPRRRRRQLQLRRLRPDRQSRSATPSTKAAPCAARTCAAPATR